MRKSYALTIIAILFLTFVSFIESFAQNVGINSTGSAPAASAGLDISFTDKGLLVPRIALTATNSASPVVSPATSLLVYNTATAGSAPNNVVPGYYYWNGSAWAALVSGSSSQWTTNGSNIYYNGGNVGIGNNTAPAYKLQVNATSNPLYLTGVQAGSNTDSLLTIINGVVKKLASTALATPSTNAWSLSGNSSLNTNFLGTTNNQSLRIRTNNLQRLYIDSLGSVSIGASPSFSTTAREKFLVDAGGTSLSPLTASTGFNAINAKGFINNYLQLNIQNRYAGTAASSDVVATADNGDETTNYIDMGINSSANSSAYFGGANDAYLYNIGQNLLIGTGTASKSIAFLTGGGTQSTNERMRIDGDGDVGIGVSNPAYKLQVNAASNPLYLGGVQTGLSTDSILTIKNGVVKRLPPSSVGSGWSLTGNAGLSALTNFLGTTDTNPLIFKVNSQPSGRIDLTNTFFGYSSALVNAGTNNTGMGLNALQQNTTGTGNTAIGNNALVNNTTGSNNIGIGSTADVGAASTTSIAIGYNALTSSSNSISIGNTARVQIPSAGTGGVALGNSSYVNSANGVAIGTSANAQAASTVAIGQNSLASAANAIAIGGASTITQASGTSSIAIGPNTTLANAASALAIGDNASAQAANAIAIGKTASVSSSATNSTAIGYNAAVTTANSMVLGNATTSVGIGSETFSASKEKLLVDAGTTTSYNVISGKGTINNYLQLNIQNKSGGTAASSDVVATADNGDETTNYIDMGINSSGNTAAYFGGADDAYLYNVGQNLLIGTGTASKSIAFLTGGGTQSTNERMRINGTGNVGIGTNNPSYKLSVAGTNPLYLGGLQTGTNTDSILTVSGGIVKRLATNALSAGGSWTTTGNSTTNTNFLGTTNNQSLRMRTNNVQRLYVDSLGSVAVGSTPTFSTAREKLLVDAGVTSSYNVISGKGTIDSYLQLNIQNRSATASASSDVVASNDAATESVNFIDMGINSSANTSTGVLGGANTGYLYSTGNDFAIGNGTAAKSLIFFTGGIASNERMRIDGNGNVGIATTGTPAAKLDVNGTFKLGASGTALSSMIKGNFNINDATTFAYGTTRQIIVTVTGATANASLLINPRSALPVGMAIAYSYVSSTNNVTIGFINNDTVARSIGNINFDISVIQ